MKLPILKCKRPGCQHEWIPRRPKLPKVCPRCKQSDWNVKRPIPPTATADTYAANRAGFSPGTETGPVPTSSKEKAI